MNLLVCIYIGSVKPFTDKMQNKIELLNEIGVLLTTYMVLLFTDYVDDL